VEPPGTAIRFGPGLAKLAAEDIGHRRLGFGERHGHGHALAGGQTIGLDHHRRTEAGQRCQRRGFAGHPFIAAGRDTGAGAKVFGKAFRAFELGRCLARSEDGHAFAAQRIGKAIDQRRFGADDDQTDPFRLAEIEHSAMIGRVQRYAFGIGGDARITRCREQLFAKAGLRQLPRQRMFASTRSQQQDIHGSAFRLRR